MADKPKPRPRTGGAPVGRRAMLGMLSAGAAGLAAAPYLQRGWEGLLAAASEVDATGLAGLLPDPGGFRYYSVVGSVPHKDRTDYELRIGGLVERPRTYTLDQLRALPQTRVVHDVQCTLGGEHGIEGWEYYCGARGHHERSAKYLTWDSVDKMASSDVFRAVPLIGPRPVL